MTNPDFRIVAEGNDITEAIRTRLLSLSITDESGFSSDVAEISLDDRDGKIAMPRTGARLDISLGYKETSLAKMGVFIVDEVELSSPPSSMRIRAHAANMGDSLKAPKTKTWGKINIGDLVSSIASNHNLTPRTAQTLVNKQISYLYQTEESDLHLLTRIANNYGAVAKPAGGNLLFVPKGQAKSASGKSLPAITLTREQITSWRANFTERSKYQSVQGYWYDKQRSLKQLVTFGENQPAYTLRHTMDSEEELIQKLKSTFERLQRGTGALSLNLPGNTNLIAESRLILSNIRSSIDGEWYIAKVQHLLSDGGYSCQLEAKTNI